MTATRTQPRKANQRRIIERPRLMALLDATEARTILLLAPAGYGKTTLARQWSKTLNGALVISLSSAHRDVAVLANDVSSAIGDTAESHVRTYVESRVNPQREARDIAKTVSGQVRAARVQWLVFDDYHEVMDSPEAEVFLETLHTDTDCRFLIASRLRPRWADSRLAVYGELFEVMRDALAMSRDESKLVLGSRRGLDDLLTRAAGWPAAIGLAAAAGITEFKEKALPSAFHRYLTDEVYRSAPNELQQQLLRVALAPDLEDDTLRELFGEFRMGIVEHAVDLGFLGNSDGTVELHPLFRDYLLQRLANEDGVEEMVDSAIHAAARRERWDRAFQLIVRFDRFDLVEGILEQAYEPLLRTGQLGTLASFALAVRTAPSLPPPVVDLAEAEIALRDGSFEHASRIAQRVATQLPQGHRLISRAKSIIGQSAFVQAELVAAEAAYREAFETAKSSEDQAEALRGWALASIQGEVGEERIALEELEKRSCRSPMDLLRYATVSLVERRFYGGLSTWPHEIDEGMSASERVRDPRARSSFAYSATYALGLRADYQEATAMMDIADALIDEYDLDFARPYADWNRAWIAIGQRRFGNAERSLQRLEDAISTRSLAFHVLNCRILRARLVLQLGRPDDALVHLPQTDRDRVIPSIYGEHLATRAIALALTGNTAACLKAVDESQSVTAAAEVRVLAAAARAIAEGHEGDQLRVLWRLVEDLGAWDPFLAAVRASADLAERFAACQNLRPALARLYERSNDMGLARRAGLRARSSRSPGDLLTPRELEVLGMLAQGLRNRDIAKALVVTQSTVKIHVRHIFEKLGVRTRAEAVTRFGLMS